MKITSWKLIDRPPTPPSLTQCAKHRPESFSGVYLILRDDQGNTGMGEASPLKGHSPDTLEETKTVLKTVLPNSVFPRPTASSGTIEEIKTVSDVAALSKQIPQQFPAARFALETALLDLLAKEQSVPLWKLFTPASNPIPINGLLSKHHFESNATQMYNDGVRVFKVKVGVKNQHKEELAHLHWLRSQFGNTIEIRLDANEAFPCDLIFERMNALAAVIPSFIEEPCVFDRHFPQEPLPFPFGADESLVHEQNIRPLLNRSDCSTFVCKPSLQGGFFRVLKLTEMAKQHHKQTVITHMFESLPAFLAAAHLAIAAHATAHCGLFPHLGLGGERTHPSFTLSNGVLTLTDAPGLGIDANEYLPQSVEAAP